MRQASETLAGRVDYIDLSPIDALELPMQVGDVNRLWIRGGFPESLLAQDDAASMNWQRSFIRSYLERDVPMFAPRLPAETIGRLWTMLAVLLPHRRRCGGRPGIRAWRHGRDSDRNQTLHFPYTVAWF
jgi:predicted AAA+ superfamily ATPase